MRTLWNEGWRFAKLPLGSMYSDMKRAELRPVALPHDWLISQTEDLYESGDGWYVKRLGGAAVNAPRVLLDFDGVYMDCDVLLNGRVICTHRYGYTPFFADLTGKLLPGDNEIAVHIRHQSPNSRWYSGAGIYRDVRLLTLPERCMIPDGFQVNTVWDGNAWTLTVEAEMEGPGETLPEAVLYDPEGKTVAAGRMDKTDAGAALRFVLSDVRTWSTGEPTLYSLILTLGEQNEQIKVGFRQIEFTTDRGLFLNGRPVKLHGVCLHHDLGALGAAFHEKAAERQLRVMMDMGVNAVRTSHNPPARQLLDLCDRLGLLVMDELFDMWELPKTDFDNARFFPETYPLDVASWVRRDRCHPSVILWSIGNEIYDLQASERGRMWTRKLTEEVCRHDSRHAAVTFASNYMPWENAQKCADIIRLPGYNYAESYYAEHHEKYPDWVIFGSETGSLLASRGIYHFPIDETILAEEDLQCSALMNSNTSWGATDIRKLLVEDLQTPYSLGQFIWSGVDYIGEPTPYHTRNCYFGQTDTACFPKDAYYFYQAIWTKKPMIHIGVYWDWNEGQLIDVPVMTNGAWAELFLNGQSLGKKRVNQNDMEESLPVWRVPYAPGILKARAYDLNGRLLCETVRASFGEAKKIALTAERETLLGGCGDMGFITVSAVDANGQPVENANCRVEAEVTGCGVLLGMDNGDSTDLDSYQTTSRRLFSGKLLLIVGAQAGNGEIRVRVTGDGLEPAEITLNVVEAPRDADRRIFPDVCRKVHHIKEETPVRKIELKALSHTKLTPDHPSAAFSVRVLPETAGNQPIRFRVVNAQGVDMPQGTVQREGDRVTVTARGDGSMYLRATAANGSSHARVLSSMEITAAGFGSLGLDPYGFVAGALADIRMGDVGAGNEQGVAFARDGESAAGFSCVDFGPVGSDEITLPVFALNDDLYHIKLWDGVPKEGGRMIADLPYQKKSIWNVYQPGTYRLPEVLKGIHTLTFSLDCKIHLKGFSFVRQSRALRYNRALDADQLYGDSFVKDDEAVRDIGNNVTLTFACMDFDRAGEMLLMIDGGTALKTNTVSLRIVNESGEVTTASCDFRQSEREEQTFPVITPKGRCTVSFVFLPGSRFDFFGFRFQELNRG